MQADILKIQQIIACFSNSFDVKDWNGLEACFTLARNTPTNYRRGGIRPPTPRVIGPFETASSG